MGVYIKGMEMPTNCASCDIVCRHYLDLGADGFLSKICRTESRRPDCPLVPVPPHGRLKDYDRIMKEYDEWFSKTESREYENMFYALRMAINGSPTIIPAEEGE